MKSRKKLIINVTILIIMVALVSYTLLKNNDINKIADELNYFDKKYLIYSIFALAAFMGLDVLIVKRITSKYSNQKKGIKSIALSAFFYNGITPLSSGGQPIQVYYMDKLGISLSKSTTILLMRFLIFQTTITIMSLIALVLYFDDVMAIEGINILIILGFSVTAAVLFVLLGVTFSRRFGAIMRWNFRTFGKIKVLSKHMKRLEEKTNTFVNDFQKASKDFFKDWKLVIEIFFYTFVRLIAYYSITYYILVGLGEPRSNELYLLSMSYASFAFAITAFIPTPGASGGAEYAFKVLFAGIIINETAAAAILLWRGFTYYLPLGIGFISAIRLGTISEQRET